MNNIFKKKYTVLVVDDNEINRDIAEEFLKDDFNILKAEGGTRALEILNEYKSNISCVLLDLSMPDLSGDEVLKIIVKSEDLKNIPVIIATVNDSPEKELQCLEQGAIDFVAKPYNPLLLKKRILNILDLKQRTLDLSFIEKDEDTNAYTRQAFYIRAKDMLASDNQMFDLVISDIVDYKIMIERYGRNKAHSLIVYTYDFIKENFVYEDYIGKYGNDKFIFLMKKQSLPASVVISSKVSDYTANATIPSARCKFSIYENVNGSSDLQICSGYAENILERLTRDYDKSVVIFNEEEKREIEKIARLSADMASALHGEQFKVYYQPKHDTKTGKLVGAEALIRWQHPEYGFISPGDFIPLFESNGFVTYADYYVWNRTCQNLRKWMNKGIEVVPISVNASKLDFEYKDYFNIIKQSIEDNDIEPRLMHIEVTETIDQKNVNLLIDELNNLRDIGFKIELDDFGSGYSSLNILGLLPLDIVKIDQSFIRQTDNPRKLRILTSCISLAKNLGLVSLCEGVETQEQLNILKEIGCDRIQGYYYSKPLSEEDFEKYLIDESKKNYINNGVAQRQESVVYMVDKNFNLIKFNQALVDAFPDAKLGEKCYRTIHNEDKPCKQCSIVKKLKGPQLLSDLTRNRFLIVDCIEIPNEKNDTDYLITLGETKMFM